MYIYANIFKEMRSEQARASPDGKHHPWTPASPGEVQVRYWPLINQFIKIKYYSRVLALRDN